MAYAAAITTEIKTISGRRHYLISVTETEARSINTFTITGLPKVATLVLYRCTLTAGTGSTIAPNGFNALPPVQSTNKEEFQIKQGAHLNESTHVPLRLVNNELIIQSTPNDATADHSISTLITIVEGAI